VVIFTPDMPMSRNGTAGFEGDIREAGRTFMHLGPHQYAIAFVSFDQHHEFTAVATDPAIMPGTFAADNFNYGETFFFRISTFGGKVLFEKVPESVGICEIRRKKLVGEQNIDVKHMQDRVACPGH
jgi:hypothetical protein